MPKVSIIVPNYNHAQYLQQRFDSIFNQSYQDFEVIILDDCSTDNSRKIIELYSNHPKVSHIVNNDLNGGTSYKQWYKGIELAQGELIWIAESDDWCDCKLLEVLVPFFEDTSVSIAYSQSRYIFNNQIEKASEQITNFNKYNGITFIRSYMLGGNKLLNASSVLFKKEVYDKVKTCGFVEMKLAGDWLLWIQIMNNYSIIAVKNQFNYCRRHTLNATNKFRSFGYDFIEGIRVMLIGKKLVNYEYNKRTLYLTWLERYIRYKQYFAKGVQVRVDLNMLTNEPLLICFIKYKRLKSFIKATVYKR